MKYTGDLTNVTTTSLQNGNNWTPVCGTDNRGYELVEKGEGTTATLAAIIYAAQKQKYDYKQQVEFALFSAEMQLTLENLPGHITQYYHMLADKTQTRYTVGFYWTIGSLENATPDNTYRVYIHADEFKGLEGNYSSRNAFDREFGANIQVPNLINKVFVQKMVEGYGDSIENEDEIGNLFIPGATFAIYAVQGDELDNLKYLASDERYYELTENPVINPETGEINLDGTTIKPKQIDVTEAYIAAEKNGSAEFSNLDMGQYIIKEIKPPTGYKINTNDIMVLVTEDTIYANAGEEDDGIMVGRGPGYVVKTLNQFASQGYIDNTPTWIYAQMRIRGESKLFSRMR